MSTRPRRKGLTNGTALLPRGRASPPSSSSSSSLFTRARVCVHLARAALAELRRGVVVLSGTRRCPFCLARLPPGGCGAQRGGIDPRSPQPGAPRPRRHRRDVLLSVVQVLHRCPLSLPLLRRLPFITVFWARVHAALVALALHFLGKIRVLCFVAALLRRVRCAGVDGRTNGTKDTVHCVFGRWCCVCAAQPPLCTAEPPRCCCSSAATLLEPTGDAYRPLLALE